MSDEQNMLSLLITHDTLLVTTVMTPERWHRISDIFDAARRRDAGDRAAFLAEVCAGDDELRREVESLLASHDQASRFIEEPAVAVAAAKLAAGENGAALSGQEIAHYRVTSLLGAGGMGEVYLAQDTRLGRRVALKLLSTDFTEDAERLRRFRLEARSASALNHPNILTIYEIGCVDSRHYIATEYIEGATLRERMNNSRMGLAEALDVAIQVTAALIAAHRAGIVHRDIKPENVMVRRDGYVKVLDFGLAKVTETKSPATGSGPEAPTVIQLNTNPGTIMGTPRYMSPEQVRGLQVDARTDLWSVGCVLYEMVTGAVPFDGETPGDLIAAILRNDPAPLTRRASEVPAGLQRIVSKALSKDREGRYQSAQDLAADLRRLSRQLEIESEPGRVAHLEPSGGAAVTTKAERAAVENVVATGARQAIDSLAVLPLANASADPDAEYLSDGITESIINTLSQLRGLRVMARSTMFRYKGQDVDPQQVGHDLGVRAVLVGRVLQRGERLLIYAELVDTADGSHVWGEQYQRELTDIFAVQDEITKRITNALRLRLSAEEKENLTKRHTENVEAYHLYLRGRHELYKYREENWRRAVAYFKQAVDEDPAYALAYAGLSYCYSIASSWFLPAKEAMASAEAWARKALEIDDALAEAHASLAAIKFSYHWDRARAESELKRAIELKPKYAEAHWGYGMYLACMGRFDEGLAEMKRARALDPLSLPINTDVGWVYYASRRYAEAKAQLEKTLELDPNYVEALVYLGRTHLATGDFSRANAAIEKACQLDNTPWVLAMLGYALAVCGRGSEARRVIEQLTAMSSRGYVSPLHMAVIFTGLGEKRQAFAWLEKAYEERADLLVTLNVDPVFGNLRPDPRFSSLLHRIGLFSINAKEPEGIAASPTHTAPKRRSRKAIDSIAILPFVNGSANPDTEYFSDGITENIINTLSQLPRLRVMARATVFSYKGRDVDLRTAGRELNVPAVIVGSVTQSGDELIVGIELVDVDDGSQLWGSRHSRPLSDIFALQQEVTEEITERLRLKLTGGNKKQLAKRYTENVEAYQLYLKGRYFWYKGTEEDVRKGVEYFRQAIERDPNYALAYSGQADCYCFLRDVPQAKAAARRALEIDGALAEAHVSLAHVSIWGDWDWVTAEREIKRALKLNPNSSDAHCMYSCYLVAHGAFDQSIAEMKHALEIDPLQIKLNAFLGIHFYLARRYDDAVEQLRKTLDMDPYYLLGHPYLALAYEQQGMYREAVASYRKFFALLGDDQLADALGKAYEATGVEGARGRALEMLVERLKHPSMSAINIFISPYTIAQCYARAGEKDQAFSWLERAYEMRSGDLIHLKVDPVLDSLRTDAMFTDLLRRVGLAS